MGTPAKTQKPATPTKKMIRLILPSGRSHGCASQNTADHQRPPTTTAPSTILDIAGARQPQKRKQRHQADADRQRRGAPDVGDLQRRRGDEAFFIGVFVGRPDDQQQERQRGAGRDHVEIGPHRRAGAGDDGGHPHVLGTAERHRRSQHRQPQEQDRGQFVRPDQRAMQAVTRHHAGKQDDDLGDHQQRRRNFDQHSQRPLRPTPHANGGEGTSPRRPLPRLSLRREP